MPFSRNVREKLLVASRRSCCICHRFCGVNVEVHHIVPQEQGGTDEEQNGIPLCFDCHANVQHYNPRHPKGTKYSPDELRSHREKWFMRVEQSAPLVSLPEHSKIDARIAEEIHSKIVEGGGYYFLRGHSMDVSYREERTESLFTLNDLFGKPDMQFMDADLESARADFASKLGEAVSGISLLTSPANHGAPGWMNVMTDFELEDLSISRPEDYKRIVQDIERVNRLNTVAAKAYLTLFNLVRTKLSLDLRF